MAYFEDVTLNFKHNLTSLGTVVVFPVQNLSFPIKEMYPPVVI